MSGAFCDARQMMILADHAERWASLWLATRQCDTEQTVFPRPTKLNRQANRQAR